MRSDTPGLGQYKLVMIFEDCAANMTVSFSLEC